MMTRRFKFNILTIASVILFGAPAMSDGPSDGQDTEESISIWNDSNLSFDDRQSEGLQTRSDDETQEPILVPLPAPVLAAGSGLGIAWLIRKRMRRA